MSKNPGFFHACCFAVLLIVVSVFPPPAHAGPNQGGSILLHWNAAAPYTSEPVWLDGGLQSCAQATPRAPAASTLPNPPADERAIWFVYAAFPGGGSPRLRGITFGVTYTPFLSGTGVSLDWHLAPPNCTEIPTPNPAWPLPGSGTSVVFPNTLTAPLTEIYMFAGYGSPGEFFSLRTHPTQFTAFGDDATPPRLDPIAGFGSLGFGVDGVPACPPPSGACCFVDGRCLIRTPDLCQSEDGNYQGDEVPCTPDICVESVAACCLSDGSCRQLTPAQCAALGGHWDLSVPSCEPNPCPQPGACCLPDGSCQILAEPFCQEGGGTWQGPGTGCDPHPCSPPGACCMPDGSCVLLVQVYCTSVDWRPDTTCQPNPCPEPGACCFPDGSCVYLVESECTTGNWRPHATCHPSPCPQPGACCHPDGTCEYVVEPECDTGTWLARDDCQPNPCPRPGACCHPDGSCVYVMQSECQNYIWHPYTPCDPNPCDDFGACCHPDGTCERVLEPACEHGAWIEGAECTPDPCPQPCVPNPAPPRRPHAELGVTDRAAIANHPPRIDKAAYLGDGMRDTREGGESWSDACLIPSLPYSDQGATCDNTDDITLPCAASAAPDVVYVYTPATSGSIDIDLCASGYDTALGFYDAHHNNIACNDDHCGASTRQSRISEVPVVGGETYYIVVDGYSQNCGSYVLEVTENAPCTLDCPVGAIAEGEPACHDGYYDEYNGGCNTTGWSMVCPQSGTSEVICGRSGTYVFEGMSYRDTDWYSGRGNGETVTITCQADFPLQLSLWWSPDCYSLIYDLVTGERCEEISLSRFSSPGAEFWVWVGPSQFTDVPCESEYILTIEGAGPCETHVGACCFPDGSCSRAYQNGCALSGGDYQGDGTSCTPNPCPIQEPCNPNPNYRRGPVDTQADVGNHTQPIVKGALIGDNLADQREGGESWNDACVISAVPFSDGGATCDNSDEITLPCAASAAPDVVYSFTPVADLSITVSLCGSGYDTALGVYDADHNNIACSDDYCGLQSQIDEIGVSAGRTYYFVVDGYSTSCGSYGITVVQNEPCLIERPPGSLVEGEPPCADGYYDAYNGGCNSTGWTVICPQQESAAEMFGKSGTFLYDGLSYRDTDWYTVYGAGTTMSVTCRAEFPLQLIVMYGTDCNNLGYDLVTGGMCYEVNLSRYVEIGAEVWVWVAPSQFNGIPCESDYLLTLDGIGTGPGCEAVPVIKSTWGAIKNRFR